MSKKKLTVNSTSLRTCFREPLPHHQLFSTVNIATIHMVLVQSISTVVEAVGDNFLEKNLCHSRDSNHRSPVFRTGALTT